MFDYCVFITRVITLCINNQMESSGELDGIKLGALQFVKQILHSVHLQDYVIVNIDTSVRFEITWNI